MHPGERLISPTEARLRPLARARHASIVHVPGIEGGPLDVREAFPDESDVDMLASIRVHGEVGFDGPRRPRHKPLSDIDPERERFVFPVLGPTRGLPQAAGAA